jgi:hypothetical protein
MAEHKNGAHSRSASSGASRRTAQASGGASRGQSERKSDGATSGMLARRQWQYLIGIRPVPGSAPSPADTIHEILNQMEDVEILRRLRPKGFQGLGAGALPGDQEIIVVRMDEKRAEALRMSAPPHVVIEQDARLKTGQVMFLAPFAAPWSGRAMPTPRRRKEIRFRVLGDGDQPLSGAGITVFGGVFGVQAITDSSGAADVVILDAETDLEDIHAIYVQPAADHWERFIQYPTLDSAEANVVELKPLFAAKSTDEKRAAWGHKAMNLDRLAAGLTGAGVKIAVIDSGCDNSHPLLRNVTRGIDLTDLDGAADWTRDEIGQGTHCTGIIAGAGSASPRVSGIATGAEIHVFKLSPGGHFSDLIEALDQCIERQIDIVHLGVGSDRVSELVAQKIIEARLKGVACIAPAGDADGQLQFPSMVPGVLCVSAVGRLGEFPQDTHHGLTAIPQSVGPTGIFATNFSGSGPQIGVCAPGVAVISSVPGGAFGARDGTATAAAHVAGFAALILAHHPLFRGVYGSRGEQRVSALFDLVRGSAVPPVFDPARVGAGLPDLQRVPGMATSEADAWNKAAQSFGIFAGAKESFAERLSAGVPPSQLAGTMALMQLRAVGLI